MITREIALTQPRELWHVSLRNADGTPLRCRSNGRCQTWKTHPADFRLPVKRGLRQCFAITLENAVDWQLPETYNVTAKSSACSQPT